MSSSRSKPKQRLEADGLEDRLGPPHKRRMTGTSPPDHSSTNAGASASANSLFGGMSGSVQVAAVAMDAEAGAAGSGDDRGGEKGAKGSKTPQSPAKRLHGRSRSVESEVPRVDRLFSDRVVTILVGPHETRWCLHENLLSGASDFFKSALNGGFKESLEGRITMPEDDPHAFELFVRWLYTRAVVPEAVAGPATATANVLLRRHFPGGPAAACIQDYLHLYVLASKLLIEDLENACVDMAHTYYGVGMRRPDIKDVQYIYDNTMPGSGMRKLMRERLTLGLFKGRQHNPVTAEWRDVMNETADLGFDVVSEIASYSWIAGGNAPGRAVPSECSYHRHDRGAACMRL